MIENLQICDDPVCNIVFDAPVLISFSVYDINGNELTESLENETLFIRGTAQNVNSVYVMDARISANIGYGVPDALGNFDIPVNIVGTDINQATTIIVMVM